MKKILFIISLIVASVINASVSYQCPAQIDKDNQKDWELVTGEDAASNKFVYDGPISAILTTGKSRHYMLYPDLDPADSSLSKHLGSTEGNFWLVAPKTWIMCSYPFVKAVYFKRLPNILKECATLSQHHDIMICE